MSHCETVTTRAVRLGKNVSSSVISPVKHSSVVSPISHCSKASYAKVVKQTVQDQHITKDDAFKRLMSFMYASYVCPGSAAIFQKSSRPPFAYKK